MLTLAPQGSWPVPIIKTEAHRGEGVEELAEKLAEHRAHVEAEGTLSERRRRNLMNEVLGIATVRLRRALEATLHEDAEVRELLDEVVARRLDPASAASAILARGAVEAGDAARPDQRRKRPGRRRCRANGSCSGGWRSRSRCPPRSASSASCARRARGCAPTRSSGSARRCSRWPARTASRRGGHRGTPRDPSRVAAQVVTGIGFIGGGLIFVRQDAVRGLTTAAGVWVTAAIGLTAAAGQAVLAIVGTAIYFLVAFGFPKLTRRLPRPASAVRRVQVTYLDGRGVLRDAIASCASRRLRRERHRDPPARRRQRRGSGNRHGDAGAPGLRLHGGAGGGAGGARRRAGGQRRVRRHRVILAQLSDPHVLVGPGGRGSAASLAAGVAAVLALRPRPDAVLVSGDLADTASAAEYERVRELLAPLPMPVHVLPGNHDDRDALRAHFPLDGRRRVPLRRRTSSG